MSQSVSQNSTTEHGITVDQFPEFPDSFNKLALSLSGRVENIVFELVGRSSGIPRCRSPTTGAEPFVGAEYGLAIPTIGRGWRFSPSFSLVDKARLGPEFFVTFPISRMIVLVEHSIVGPRSYVLDLLGCVTGLGKPGDSGMAEVVGVYRLVNATPTFTLLEQRSNSILTQGPLLGIGSIVATEDVPERSFVSWIRMMSIDVLSKLGLAIENWIPFVGRTFVTYPIGIGLVIGAFGIEIMDIADTKLCGEPDSGTGIRQEFDQRLVTGISRGFFEIGDVFLIKHRLFVDTAGTLRRKFDLVGEIVVSVTEFLVQPSEENFEGSLVIEDPTTVSVQTVSASTLRGSQCTEERPDVSHLHFDERRFSPLRSVTKGAQIGDERVGFAVLITLPLESDELLDRVTISIGDIGFSEVLPLIIELPEGVIRVVHISHIPTKNMEILGSFRLRCARCSASWNHTVPQILFENSPIACGILSQPLEMAALSITLQACGRCVSRFNCHYRRLLFVTYLKRFSRPPTLLIP